MSASQQSIDHLLAVADQRRAAGDRAGAVVCHEEILRLAPHHAASLLALADLYLPASPVAAATFAQRAVDATPHDVEALSLLARALSALGRTADAVQVFRAAADRAPAQAEVHCNLCLALTRAGDIAGAITAGEWATRLNPRMPEASTNLGHALNLAHEYPRAMAAFRAALALRPDNPDTLSGIATAQAGMGHLSTAITALQRAVAVAPGWANAWSDLAILLGAFGDASAAREAARQAALLSPDNADFASNALMGLQYDPAITEAAASDQARIAGLAACARAPRRPVRRLSPQAGRKPRIGYVSADLRRHPVGWLGGGAIMAHDRDAVFVAVYANQTARDDLTDALMAAVDRWHWVHGMDDEALTALIEADGIDILIDLSGHTAGNRLPVFAQRAAPLQISWLGYFATTGLPTMDHALWDDDHLHGTAEALFTERVVRLPSGRFTYRPPADAPAPRMPQAGPVVFGSFNNSAKINRDVIAVWAAVLRAVPDSVLLLKWRGMDDPALCRRLRRLFAEHEVDGDRVRFRNASPHATMLEEYGEVDIALDPFPFSGALTTCEALWMGVPVVTLPGRRPVSRQSRAILRRIGLDAWSADSAEAYVEIAAILAADRDGRVAWRTTLRARMAESALCDHRGLAAVLEATYRRLLRDRGAAAG